MYDWSLVGPESALQQCRHSRGLSDINGRHHVFITHVAVLCLESSTSASLSRLDKPHAHTRSVLTPRLPTL